MEEILKVLGTMARLYSSQRGGVQEISLKIAAALVITFIKRGVGRYLVVDSTAVHDGFEEGKSNTVKDGRVPVYEKV